MSLVINESCCSWCGQPSRKKCGCKKLREKILDAVSSPYHGKKVNCRGENDAENHDDERAADDTSVEVEHDWPARAPTADSPSLNIARARWQDVEIDTTGLAAEPTVNTADESVEYFGDWPRRP